MIPYVVYIAIRLFAGCVGYFLVGLKSDVGGHFPVTRAIAAASLAVASGFGALRLIVGAGHFAWPVAFVVLLFAFYRPRIWMVPACVLYVAGLEWTLHRVL